MISKFTHPSFEIDFDGKNLNIVEENHWFSDQFFTKYSFPLEFDITDELDAALQMITHNNAARSPKTFEGYFQNFGEETEAVFIIERVQGRKGQGKLRYGFEEFPNFNKKLAELDLERFTLTEPITDFAVNRLNQSYPAVNFNFPQLIIDAVDTDSEQWKHFEGIMNNYRSGAFLLNEYDAGTSEQINRNIMQPMPYLLYVIAQGFAEAGLELQGDILTDPEFKDAVISMVSEYYTTSSVDNTEFYMKANDYYELETIRAGYPMRYDLEVGNYARLALLLEPGIYKVAGNAILRAEGNVSRGKLVLNGQTIWEAYNSHATYKETFYTIDRNVEVPVGRSPLGLQYFSQQLPYAVIDQNNDPEAMILDLTITKIAGYDVDGNLVPTLVMASEINLQRCVPDMTFGDLLKAVKNWKNYDISIGDGVVTMNKIQNEMKLLEQVDLSEYEVREPLREFYQDSSFLLQFQEVNSDEYTFIRMFIDANGPQTSSIVKREDTSEITINGLPLPLKQKGTVNTAHLFLDGKDRLVLTIYPGLDANGLNLARDSGNLLIPAVYENDWSVWIDFRINAEGFEWPFFADAELSGQVSRKSQVFAYGRKFVVRRVSKKKVSRNWWEVTIECDGE